MHVLAHDQGTTLRAMVRQHGGIADRSRAAILWIASRLFNYQRFDTGPRVTLDALVAGQAGLTLSVLYAPFSELDLAKPYGAPPEAIYFDDLLKQIELVEDDLRRLDPERKRVTVVRTAAELDAALAAKQIAFVHCIEGGFHLGADPQAVDRNVARLAQRGVAYITLAHLFWRRVAANANALPFLSDKVYDRLFPQPGGPPLTELGVAAVKAMYREQVIVDLSHMRPDALQAALALLDGLDRESGAAPADHPVIASHGGFRFGRQAYNLDETGVRAIAARDGVIGLILAQHQLNDGVRRTRTKTLNESVDVIARHVDRIRDITGSHDHTALGTDFDGFIQPTMGGLEGSAHLPALAVALRERYGEQDAEKILSGNVQRVIRRALAARAGPAPPPAP
jgi:microsomal dipeptidase-like Zn-dependent dipeptidase